MCCFVLHTSIIFLCMVYVTCVYPLLGKADIFHCQDIFATCRQPRAHSYTGKPNKCYPFTYNPMAVFPSRDLSQRQPCAFVHRTAELVLCLFSRLFPTPFLSAEFPACFADLCCLSCCIFYCAKHYAEVLFLLCLYQQSHSSISTKRSHPRLSKLVFKPSLLLICMNVLLFVAYYFIKYCAWCMSHVCFIDIVCITMTFQGHH